MVICSHGISLRILLLQSLVNRVLPSNVSRNTCFNEEHNLAGWKLPVQ